MDERQQELQEKLNELKMYEEVERNHLIVSRNLKICLFSIETIYFLDARQKNSFNKGTNTNVRDSRHYLNKF